MQPAEFAKFATALALAKFMNVYGFTMSKLKYSLPVVGMVLLPMLLIILQRETGSALVYLAFFFMLYREGMPGSILFAGICAVVYFVVGIRFGNELMADDCTSIGEFSVLLLIVILSALLVNSYCKKASVVWYIGAPKSNRSIQTVFLPLYQRQEKKAKQISPLKALPLISCRKTENISYN